MKKYKATPKPTLKKAMEDIESILERAVDEWDFTIEVEDKGSPEPELYEKTWRDVFDYVNRPSFVKRILSISASNDDYEFHMDHAISRLVYETLFVRFKLDNRDLSINDATRQFARLLVNGDRVSATVRLTGGKERLATWKCEDGLIDEEEMYAITG